MFTTALVSGKREKKIKSFYEIEMKRKQEH